jgi:hypothetical protein
MIFSVSVTIFHAGVSVIGVRLPEVRLMYICMYRCVITKFLYMYSLVCKHGDIYFVYKYIGMCINTYANMYKYRCKNIYLYIYIYIYIYICIHVYILMCT